MYKITSAKYDNETRVVVGYTVNDGNKTELLTHDTVYWLTKAGLIDNATAKEVDNKPVIETDAIIGMAIDSEEFQIKSKAIYEAIRRLNSECTFNLNTELCNVMITGAVYKYNLDKVRNEVLKNALNNLYYNTNVIEDNIEYVGYEVRNTGNHMIYYVTYNLVTGETGMDILNPGETVVLSVHALKLLLAQKNVTCENGYLQYDVYGPDAEPTKFEIDDDILFRTTHDIKKKVCFNSFSNSVMKSIMSEKDINEQLTLIEEGII